MLVFNILCTATVFAGVFGLFFAVIKEYQHYKEFVYAKAKKEYFSAKRREIEKKVRHQYVPAKYSRF